MAKNISNSGIELIKSFEGFVPVGTRYVVGYDGNENPIYDSVNCTIGYGHCGADVKAGQKITEAQAIELLKKDLQYFVSCVNNKTYCPVTDKLNQNQFDALVSICYNCGAGGLQALCKGKTVAEIGKAIPTHYCYSNGVFLQGLANRRKKEQELFNKPCSIKYKLKANAGAYLANETDPIGKSSVPKTTIPKGSTVTWKADDGYGWSKVVWNDKTYWIVNSHIDCKALSSYQKIVVKKGNVVRRVPIKITDKNRKFETKTTLNKDTTFKCICTITSGKYKGYSYLKLVSTGKNNGRFYYCKIKK